jgi:hypothetical protein
LGGGVLASPHHACTSEASVVTSPRGVIPSLCCHTSVHAISTAYSRSVFKASCTDISTAAISFTAICYNIIRYATISTTTKSSAPRRMESVYEVQGALPSQKSIIIAGFVIQNSRRHARCQTND